MVYKVIAEGTVEALGVTAFGETISQLLPELQLLVNDGVKGDRHGGVRLSDVREKVLAAIGVGKEVPMANVRQFSAISVEELTEVSREMGTPDVIPFGLCAENLVVSGISNFTQLPAGTLLCFAKGEGDKRINRKAVLAVWEENIACRIPNENIVAHFRVESAGFRPTKPYATAARHLRGVVGFVYCSGKIKVGDAVSVWSSMARD